MFTIKITNSTDYLVRIPTKIFMVLIVSTNQDFLSVVYCVYNFDYNQNYKFNKFNSYINFHGVTPLSHCRGTNMQSFKGFLKSI